MTYSLPQEVQTKKRNSLPDDLKSIADELIAKKFGIEEEVLVNHQDVFLSPKGHIFGCGCPECLSSMDYRRSRGFRDDFNPTRDYPPADEWGIAVRLIKSNARFREQMGVVEAHSEIRLIDMRDHMRTIMSLDAGVNVMMSDSDMRGYNVKENLINELAHQYHDKIVNTPRGMYVIDY